MAEETEKSRKELIKEKISQAFARVGKLTRIQRLLICVLTLAAIGGSFYYFIYMPKSDALAQAENELKTQTEKLNIYKIRARTIKKWEKKMKAVEDAFHIAMSALPDKKEVPSLLTGVSRAGSRAGLNFLLFQPDPEIHKEFYKEIPLSMKVEGSYHQIADFFFQVARLNRIVNIKNMNIRRDAKEEGHLQMDCNAVTYMFAEPETGKKGKKKG